MQIGHCKEFLSWLSEQMMRGQPLQCQFRNSLCWPNYAINSGDDTTLIDRLVDWLIDWSIDWRGKIEEQEKSIFLNFSHQSICVVHSGCKEYVAGCRNISCEENINLMNWMLFNSALAKWLLEFLGIPRNS